MQEKLDANDKTFIHTNKKWERNPHVIHRGQCNQPQSPVITRRRGEQAQEQHREAHGNHQVKGRPRGPLGTSLRPLFSPHRSPEGLLRAGLF